MNLLMINGSPNNAGNTNKILELLSKEMSKTIKGDNYVCSTISLSQKSIEHCHGCRICFNDSELHCPYKDDVNSIKCRMEEADIIIIGSPVYVEDVTGITKNWIDRMAYNCHRPFLRGKLVYIITTSGAGASSHAIKTLKHALVAWGAQIVNYDNYHMGIKMKLVEAEKLYSKIITIRINELIHRINNSRINMYSLIAFNVQKKYWSRKNIDTQSFDYKYWKKQGWLTKKCFYYHPINDIFFKKNLAILFSKLIGILMKA